ncbi:GNAT family N-acetyltransferase [Paenibacillus dakarensis]|uniref:GNAT family N-acetyltransferase n=1 Tax=Paenibacillus dakarensis TaxID=1527293 RepID=UPI001FE1CAD8|nr:GNAT family N-acetyltransferase [Paenibacillus dakarensis]
MEQFETGQGFFSLCLAGQEDKNDMLYILRETAELMVRDGLNQWTPSLFSLELMEEYVTEREVFLLKFDHKPAGLFTLQDSDPAYWGERNDQRFLYLHRLAVLPGFRGLQLGQKMIRFAEERAGNKEKIGLRLDCVSHLEGLNQFYKRQGFEFIAKQSMGKRFVHLYEKRFSGLS